MNDIIEFKIIKENDRQKEHILKIGNKACKK